jgi:hypothetical protein
VRMTPITRTFLVRKLENLAVKPVRWVFIELLRSGFV